MLPACPSVHTTSASKNHRRSSAVGRFQSMMTTKAKAGKLRNRAGKKFDDIGHARTVRQEFLPQSIVSGSYANPSHKAQDQRQPQRQGRRYPTPKKEKPALHKPPRPTSERKVDLSLRSATGTPD